MAKSKFLNTLSGVILPVITAVVTIILFFIWKPKNNLIWHLFVFNMLYVVFLEVVLFCYIGFIKLNEKAESSSLFKLAKSNFSLYYILFGVIFMLLYHAFLRAIPMSARYYYAIILLVTLVWVIVGAIILRTGKGKKREPASGDFSKELNTIMAKMKVLSSRYATLQEHYGKENEKSVDSLMSEVNSVSSKNVKTEASLDKLNSIVDGMDKLLDEAEAADAESYDGIAERIATFAKMNRGKIEQIKVD